MTKRSRKRPLSLKDYFIPHRRNDFKPHIFRTTSLTVFVIGLLVIQGAYFAQVNLLFMKTNFLASVLPSALEALTNTDRTANNVAPVTDDPVLDQAAQLTANDMAAKGYFAHVSPDGKTPWYWLQQVGYDYQYAGQNLAVNFTDSTDVENAWMNSPTHRANIVKSQYTKVGIGVANGMYEGKDATFVVQYFASPGESAEMPVSQTTPNSAQDSATVPPTVTATTDAIHESATATVPQVLGTQAAPHVSPSVPLSTTAPALATATAYPTATAAEISSSPRETLLYVLCGLVVLVGISLLVEIIVKTRLRYVEMTSGGFAMLVLLFALILFNALIAPKGIIPSQSASVNAAFSAR